MFMMEMNPQASFSTQKSEQSAKGTKGPAKKPAGEQFQQNNQQEKYSFKGNLLKKHKHHYFPAY